MKLKLILLAACAALPNLQATTITWQSDSDTSFDLLLTGTGFDPVPGTIPWSPFTPSGEVFTSPSGLWTLGTARGAGYFGESGNFVYSNVLCSVFSSFGLTTGDLVYTNDYLQIQPASDPLIYSVDGIGSHIIQDSLWKQYGWQGLASIVIFSRPTTDPSTWSWVAQYQASGSRVPDGGNSALMLAFASGLLFLFKFRLTKSDEGDAR